MLAYRFLLSYPFLIYFVFHNLQKKRDSELPLNEMLLWVLHSSITSSRTALHHELSYYIFVKSILNEIQERFFRFYYRIKMDYIQKLSKLSLSSNR